MKYFKHTPKDLFLKAQPLIDLDTNYLNELYEIQGLDGIRKMIKIKVKSIAGPNDSAFAITMATNLLVEEISLILKAKGIIK